MSAPEPRVYCYELPGSWIVLAGATERDNDNVSVKLAAPRDWWFHAEGLPGSHVILRAKPDEDPSRETLQQAASVAAYHSKGRGAGMVRVYCTRARNVSKPRGVKAGTVQVIKGKVLKVRPEIGFATRLSVGPDRT